jgi:hypothetical protein
MKTDTKVQLIVRNIISDEIDGHVRVTVANELFNAIRGLKPALPYKGAGDLGGNGVRVFNIDGVDLYVHYDKEARQTMFIMKSKDANACLKTLVEERANETKLPFNMAKFVPAQTA